MPAAAAPKPKPKPKPKPTYRAMKVIPTKEKLRDIANLTLANVANDPNAPSAARAAAARTLLESLGDIGRLQELAKGKHKPLNEMTKQEIDAEIERLEPKVKERNRGKLITPAQRQKPLLAMKNGA